MAALKKFSVVHFMKDNTIEAVPSLWLNKKRSYCYFPPGSRSKLSKLRTDPTSEPDKESCENLVVEFKCTADTYQKASQQATHLQFTSTVESSDSSVDQNYYESRKRKRKPNSKLEGFVTSSKSQSSTSKLKKTIRDAIETSSDNEDCMDLEINIPGHLDPIFKGSRTDTVGNEDTTAVSLDYIDNGTEEREGNDTQGSSPTTFGQVLSEEIVDGPQLISKIDSIQAEFRRFQEVVINELKDIKSDLDVVRSAVVKQNQCRKPTCPFKIPITNDVDLDAAEVILATEQGSFKNWCVSIGGSSASHHVRRILARIFLHEYSLKFNFTGKCGKKAYSKLAIREVVNNALVESHKVTENIVDEISANFFRYAKDQNGGRSKRTKS